MPAPILVTGAAGFVGSHLLELLGQDGAEIIAWQRPGTAPLVAGHGVRWATVEMQDAAAVRAAVADARPQAVYHLAGMAHVGDSWGQTRETFAGNVLATHHLFEALRRTGLAPRVLVTSSATVYTPADHALREDDPVCPNNPYGTSKLAQEMVARRSWLDDGIPGLIARAFNHVGPRQAPSFLAPSVARQIAAIEAGRLEPVLMVGNLEPRRDLMDVRDTVRAYRAMMQSAAPGVTYNVCSGRPVPVKDLINLFVQHARVPIRIEQDPARFRPNDTPLLLGDASRLHGDTGWSTEITLDQTVEDLIDYWRGQP
ncbi:MAG: GDP-6-deoxy-D-mannose reductase [Acidobacteriota bacterium]|jgi:GDP-4-dehydro-6-deoxy-D-mannose reductase